MNKKMPALLVIIMMLVNLFSVPALATITDTKDNTAEYNQEMLDSLKTITGDSYTVQSAQEALEKLGLLNGDGDPGTSTMIDVNGGGELDSAMIEVNGKQMTLAEVWELVNSEGVNLDEVATVDDTLIKLRDLKTMIEIENEIQRIKNTYFSDVTLDEAHQKTISSLRKQIAAEGIKISSTGAEAEDEAAGLVFPSGIDQSIYADIDVSTQVYETKAGTQSVAITLKDKNGVPLAQVPGYDISVSYRFVEGSAEYGIEYGGHDGTVTFTANSTEATKTLPFTIISDYMDRNPFAGQKSFLMQFYNPQNIIFQDGKRAVEKLIKINCNFEVIKEPFLSDSTDGYVTLGAGSKILFEYDRNILNNPMISQRLFDKVDVKLSGGTVFINNPTTSELYELYPAIFGQRFGGLMTFKPVNSLIQHDGTVDLNDTIYDDLLYGDDNKIELSFWADDTEPWDDPSGTKAQLNLTISFIDTIKPYVTSYYIDTKFYGQYVEKKFTYGQSIPISVWYSEPVNLSNATLIVNGETLTPVEADSIGVNKATFLYPVKEVDDPSLHISTPRGVTDLVGNSQEVRDPSDPYNAKDEFTTSDLIQQEYKLDSFKSASASLGTGANGKTTCNVAIDLNDNQDVTAWLASEASANYDETVDKYKVPSIYASIDGGKTKIDLYADDADKPTKLVGSFVPEVNESEAAKTGVVEFYLDPVINSTTNPQLMVGTCATYTVDPMVFLASSDLSITDNFPAEGIISAEEGGAPALSYTVSNANATWKDADDFSWSSSDESIAAIAADGKISLTGTPGDVTFTLTAKNGNIANKAVSINSRTLTVKAGLTPFLLIPDSLNVISIKNGDSAEVRWTTNLIAKNAENGVDTVFRIEVFAADYTEGTVKKGSSVYQESLTVNQDNPVSSYVIPAEYLSNLSELGRYSYIVEVSSFDPYAADQMMTASSYISIGTKPATVKLAKLNQYFITDRTTQIPISWTLENVDTVNRPKFEFEITSNDNNSSVYKQTTTENSGGAYALNIPAVTNGFKDIYTVTVKAKNAADEAWSQDSFVLYVYSDGSLKVWIEGADPGTSYTMSNIEKISSMTSDEILALKRDINLKNVVSINYGDHAWGQISDQIKWHSSDSSVGSLNYEQGGYYRNIEEIPYDSYRPETKFALSGLHDGNTQLTVTHAATGLQRTVNVGVETLKDKLYLFKIYPQAKTTLTYNNGNGDKCSVDTNEKGELALFEDSGIASEIYLESTVGDKTYMGTLYSGLVSSEKDSTQLELYPLNIIKLRESATVELYFKKPDGTPYSGDVVLKGGVYKNDKYCPEALLNKKTGNADQTITVGNDGKFKVEMNTSQFWCESNDEILSPEDKLEFVYEVHFPDDQYYPQLISLNGNMSCKEITDFGESIIDMETVSDSDKYKPFIAMQTIDYGLENGRTMDVRKFTGKIGPSTAHEKVILNTTVLWWGEAEEDNHTDHNLFLEDQYGVSFKNQTHETVDYPFTSMVSTCNTFVLDRDTVEDWASPVQELHLVLTDADINRYIKKEMPFRAANMLDVPKAIDSDSLIFTLDTLSSSAEANANSLSLSDEMIGGGLTYLSQQGTGSLGDLFKMVIAPTADPTVYVALIATNLGGLSNEDPSVGSELEYTPGLSDAMDMMKGKYAKEQSDTFNKNSSKNSYSETEFSFVFGGYMEAEVYYNFEKSKWEVLVLNGGFNAGAGIDYKWNYNTMVGPIPVTAQLGVGASAEVIFQAAVQRGETIKITYDKDAVNDYLTTLRIYAYFKAFAGVGFDYSVVALKIGLFGRISLDAKFAWLNQSYASKKRNGQNLTVNGQIGIEADAKYLFFSEEYILASKKFNIAQKSYNDWNTIQDTWGKIGKGSNDNIEPLALEAGMEQGGSQLYPVSIRSVIEGRDYLNQFNRTWTQSQDFGLQSLDEENGVKDLQTNAYPFANPVLSDDGQIMAYISDADSDDIEKTHVCWTMMRDGSYPNGSPIVGSLDGYGDSQLKLAGNKDFAAAVWVTQRETIPKEAGEEVSNSDIALMSNGTEVMASVYDGSNWTTTQLSENGSPDMAPVAAANDSKILVAWRNVYALDSSHPLEFTGADNILYRIYDRNTKHWSDTRTLYNGTNGAVKGLEAAMLDDGTAAVTYSYNTSGSDNLLTVSDDGQDVNSGMEVVYAVVNPDGNIIKNVQLTNDTYLDENPQLTEITFGDNINRFVIGWYSIHSADGISTNDIRLCAFDKNGAIYKNFIDSISSINTNANVNISSNFEFIKNVNMIDNLSILWEEPAETGTAEDGTVTADKDLLKAVKFISENGKIFITSALDVAEMDDFALIDHFDAYKAANDTIKAVILGTHYDNGYKENVVQVEEDGELVDQIIYTPIARSDLHTATATYENKMEVQAVAVDYQTILPGANIPVQFTLFNAGVQPINSITIQIGDNVTQFDEDLLLQPNENINLTAYYDIPADEVVNPVYTITANFGSEMPTLADQDVYTDSLYMDVPDVGISKTKIVSEENGERVIQVALYNNSGVALAGSDRTVKIGLFTDPECTNFVKEVNGQESGEPFSVDAANLSLIDAGAYTKQFTFDIAEHVVLGNEIPESGVRIYVKAWIEETLLTDDTSEDLEMLEYYQNNNTTSILFDSLLTRNNDQPVTICTELNSENGVSTVVVDLQNNSLGSIQKGNLIVSLLDENGRILDTKRTYNNLLAGEGLINLDAEETTQSAFTFDSQGASVVVSYSDIVQGDEGNTGLSSHYMRGIPLQLVEGQTEYYFETENLTATFISIAAEDPNAFIWVNGVPTDLGNAVVDLVNGLNTITITITAADGTTTQTYTVTINNNPTQNSGNSHHSGGSASEIPSVTGEDTVLNLSTNAINREVLIRLSDTEFTKLINKAQSNDSPRIIIKTDIEEDADKVSTEMPMANLSDIVSNTEASLTIETPIFSITLPHDTLAGIATTGGNNFSITAEKQNDTMVLSITVDGKELDHLEGEAAVVIPSEKVGLGMVAVIVKPDGEEIIPMSFVIDGKMTILIDRPVTLRLIDNTKTFEDLQNHWAMDSAIFVSARQLFEGTSSSTFDPNVTMTRGMAVTVLGRLSGIDTSDYINPSYQDVDAGTYYAPYIDWAARVGIVNGVSDNRFAPEEAISREQLATILVNYTGFAKLTLQRQTGDINGFTDDGSISDYARNAIRSMQEAGIINGKGNNLFDPQNSATRAEVAAMLERLIKNSMQY